MANKKKVPNPDGRKGSPAHQKKVNEIKQNIESRGLLARLEYYIKTPFSRKRGRFLDTAGLNPATQALVEAHQVGKQTKKEKPIKRERDAIEDIEQELKKRGINIKINFEAYNK